VRRGGLMRVFRTTAVVVALAAIFVASAAAFGFTDEALHPPDLQLGSSYSFQLSAQSGCPPYHYDRQSGEFPPGVSMTGDGLISGTPQGGGTYQTSIAVKTQCPGESSESLFTFYVVDPAPLRIRMGGWSAAVKGSAYAYRLLSTEGGVVTWTLDAGRLPEGLRLTKEGWILGLPRVTGSFLFRVKADDGRRTATETFPLDVVTRLALSTRTRLPSGSVGRHYHMRLGGHGGVPPYRWQMLQGSPPRGVRFAYAVFAGTPRVAGTFRITVRLWDAVSMSSTRTFALTVRR
jgi:hypothetical protein